MPHSIKWFKNCNAFNDLWYILYTKKNMSALIQGVFYWWLLLGARRLAPKKLIFFQDKFYSWKVHAHYFSVFIHLATWRAAKRGIFTHFMFTDLPRCIYIYIYSIQIPNCFLWVLDQSRDHTSSYYCRPKKNLCYPLTWHNLNHLLLICHMDIFLDHIISF